MGAVPLRGGSIVVKTCTSPPVPVFTASSPNVQYSAATSRCPRENNQASPPAGQQFQTVLSLDNRITSLRSPGKSLSLSPAHIPYLTPHSGLRAPPTEMTVMVYTGCPANPNRWTKAFTPAGAPETRQCHLQLLLPVKSNVFTPLKIAVSITSMWGLWRRGGMRQGLGLIHPCKPITVKLLLVFNICLAEGKCGPLRLSTLGDGVLEEGEGG